MFTFGEKLEDYNYKVLNEREVRASAGLMFLFGIISFFVFIHTQDIFYAEVFSLTFILEFVVRMFINPKYAPYMILGKLIVINQSPEWVEASPKRFAWFLGLLLAAFMSYYILMDIVNPTRGMICIACLILLFLESAFGICLGCVVYGLFKRKNQQDCSGDQCEISIKRSIGLKEAFAFIAFLFVTYSSISLLQERKEELAFEREDNIEELHPKSVDKNECNPPQWAIDMGHREMWKQHNCR